MFSPARLLAGLVVLTALLVPAYFLLIRDPADPGIGRAAILETTNEDGLDVGLDLGDKAPNFEVSTPTGERVRLSDFEGRPLVLNFWATWCTSCLAEMPDLKDLQEEMGLDAFGVLAVNAGETRREAQEFIDFLQAPFVFGLDPGLVLTDAYSVYGLPLSVFLDAKGVVRGVYPGHASPEVLDTYVTAAIEAEPPGEIPVVLRTVYPVWRPRVLNVSTAGSGNLTFTSKALRCDLSYCATGAVNDALDSLTGMQQVTFAENADQVPQVNVDFDATVLHDDDIVAAVLGSLESLEDPVYRLPLQIEFLPATD